MKNVMLATYFIITSFYKKKSGFMLLNPDIERGETAAMFLCCVKKDWLIHGDSHRQPRPESK